MKTNSVKILAGTCALLSAGAAMAAEPGVAYNNAPAPSRSEQVFRGNELSIDLYGGLALGKETIQHISRERVVDDARLGVGVGMNYFFNRHFGIGGEAYTENTDHSFIDDASASILVRFPIDSARLAPYLFVGGGYEFDPIEQAFAHGGVGLEYRFADHVGMFIDARYVLTADSKDYGLARLGFRFSF